ELSELRLVLERRLGVLLDTTTEKLTQALSEVLRSQPIASAGLLLERLRSSGTECELLAEHLLDGETRFFRHPAALQALAAVVLPELERRKPEPPRSLRILSAGCSTGEGGELQRWWLECEYRGQRYSPAGPRNRRARTLSAGCFEGHSRSPGATILRQSRRSSAGQG